MNGIKSQKNRYSRAAGSFRRTEGKKLPIDIVHIICEGATEVNYIKDLIKPYRLPIEVYPADGSNPVTIVRQAKEILDAKPEIDYMFCVFDGDDPVSCKKALKHLKDYNAKYTKPKLIAIVSTPCFEIWPLLHFVYTSKPYQGFPTKKSAADKVIIDLKKYLRGYYKTSIDWHVTLRDKLPQAIENAKKLNEHNEASADKDSTNTTTNMHELVLKIQELGQQKMQHLKKLRSKLP